MFFGLALHSYCPILCFFSILVLQITCLFLCFLSHKLRFYFCLPWPRKLRVSFCVLDLTNYDSPVFLCSLASRSLCSISVFFGLAFSLFYFCVLWPRVLTVLFLCSLASRFFCSIYVLFGLMICTFLHLECRYLKPYDSSKSWRIYFTLYALFHSLLSTI